MIKCCADDCEPTRADYLNGVQIIRSCVAVARKFKKTSVPVSRTRSAYRDKGEENCAEYFPGCCVHARLYIAMGCSAIASGVRCGSAATRSKLASHFAVGCLLGRLPLRYFDHFRHCGGKQIGAGRVPNPLASKTTSRNNFCQFEDHRRFIRTSSAISIRGKVCRSVSVDASIRGNRDRLLQHPSRPMSALLQ